MATHRTSCKSCGTVVHGSPIGMECDVCSDNDWLWTCDRHGPLATAFPAPHTCHRCAYVFQSQAYTDMPSLAQALAAEWPVAVRALERQPLGAWVRDALDLPVAADVLDRFATNPQLDHDQQLAAALLVLDPGGPFYWEGHACDEAKLTANPKLALRLLEGPLPECCTFAGTHLWLPGMARKWQFFQSTLRDFTHLSLAEPSREGLITLALQAPTATGAGDAIALAMVRAAMRIRELSSALAGRRRHLEELRKSLPPTPRRRRWALPSWASLEPPPAVPIRPAPGARSVPREYDDEFAPISDGPLAPAPPSAADLPPPEYGISPPEFTGRKVVAALRSIAQTTKHAWSVCKRWLAK